MPVTLSSPISPDATSGPFYDRTSHASATSDSLNHSPFGSADGARLPHPINAMWRDNHELLSPASASDKPSESRQANFGSAPPSFVKKGSGYFGLGGANHEQSPLEQLAEERIDSAVEAKSPVSPPRTATLDGSGGPYLSKDRRVVVVDISPWQSSIQARSGDAPMGFAIAIKDLGRMGHPVHILTTLSSDEDVRVREWLHSLDLSVGFASDNEVAALWHVPAGDDAARMGVS